MTFDLEKARAAVEHLRENIEEEFSCMCGVCHVCGFNPEETLGALAEIERLRADNAALSKAVIDIQEERDLAQAEFRAYHKAWEDGAARIKELDGMLDARSKEVVGRIQECQACQIDQLRAEGEIGPGTKPRSWQITDVFWGLMVIGFMALLHLAYGGL